MAVWRNSASHNNNYYYYYNNNGTNNINNQNNNNNNSHQRLQRMSLLLRGYSLYLSFLRLIAAFHFDRHEIYVG